MKYEIPQGSTLSGLGQIYFENDVAFYQLSLLTNDLALSESLYAQLPKEFDAELCAPNTISRLEIAKTPAKIFGTFIVPNGYVDRDDKDSPRNRTTEERSDAENRASPAVLDEDPWTINFEWLETEIYGNLTDASPATAFLENLEFLRTEIGDRVASGGPTMETLYVKYHDLKKTTRTHPISIGIA